jgi:hypothetical protein
MLDVSDDLVMTHRLVGLAYEADFIRVPNLRPLSWHLSEVKIEYDTETDPSQKVVATMATLMKARRTVWNEGMDERLKQAVRAFGVQNWTAVSEIIGIDRKACRARWVDHLSQISQRMGWSKEEDKILRRGVATHGKHWNAIALLLPDRTPKQCQNRYWRLDTNERDELMRQLGESLEEDDLYKQMDPANLILRSEAELDWQDETWS